MAWAPISAVSFSVANSLVAVSPVTVGVANDARPADAVEFSLSRAVLDSWEAETLWTRAVIEVAGEIIPDVDLVSGPTIDDPEIESHTGGWSFQVCGRAWSLTRTEKVFSRATAVRIWLQHGAEGAVVEPTEPDYSGYVIGCDQASTHMPRVTVHCGDAASLYEKFETCEEIEPFALLTRMGITQLLAGAAGIDVYEGPSGAVYDKPLQAISKRLFETLKLLWEPEGCRIYMRGFDTIVVEKPRIKLPPEAPDYVWYKDDLEPGGIKCIPPEDCPSRWIVRGTTAVVVDENGVATELSQQTVEDLYAPKVATLRQDALTGDADPTGLDPLEATLRVVRKVEIETKRRGGKVISQIEREFGWKNIRAARLVSHNGPGGTAPDGYDYRPVYIDETGAFVVWTQEKFVLLGERETTNTYSAAGDIESARIDLRRWYLKTRAVRSVGDAADETTVANSYVFDDDQSYSDSAEVFGLAERQNITYTYRTPLPGPLIQTQQDTYRYERIRSRVDGAANVNYYICFDGKGQYNESTATWRLVETKISDQLLNNDLMLIGKTDTLKQFAAPEKTDGAYDWGGGLRSNSQQQTFHTVHREPTAYNVLNEAQFEQVTYPVTGGRQVTLILGSLPTTLYSSSAWTRVQMQPFEELVDDATALAWFGFSREALQHEFAQNPVEALRIITMRRRRRMSPKFEVTRPDHAAKVGSTVHLISPDDGINARCIVAARSRDWGRPLPRGVYRLEEWQENVA